MTNPLLQDDILPAFHSIKPEHVVPAIDQILAESRARIAELVKQEDVSWDSLAQQLDDVEDRLGKAWSPVSHLNSVMNNEELRKAYNECLPKLSEYSTEVGQNAELCEAFKRLAASEEYSQLDPARRKSIDNTLRDFHLAGVDLPADKKARYAELSQRLSQLSSKFSENVLDSTHAWSKLVTDAAELAGMPESALAAARQAAQRKEQEGYLLTLDFPSYYPVMTYCDNRELRREMYQAYTTRASAEGPGGAELDNSGLIDEILELRHELAQLLGFANFAEYSLVTKMAKDQNEVLDFLNELAAKSVPVARREFEELARFARDQFGHEDLQAWDVGYYSEKLREHRYAISQEELRPWFPVDQVVSGMFQVAERLFGVQIQASDRAELWHPDARYYEVYQNGEQVASFYTDLYAREKKKGGAWMGDCRVRRRLSDGSLQLPVAYLVCNFNPPLGDQPALLTHDEVTTLFHEFGHGLHHMLTKVECSQVSGINGVPWDAVELPSQFMENWCWAPEAIALISRHYQTGEPLPQAMLDKLLAAKNFQAGMQMVRQLEFALFDFRLHAEYRSDQPLDVQALLDEVRRQVAVIQAPAFNRFQNSFSHIFAGGYAAGYYSYKWAEVLAADAFSRFEEEGVFSARAGEDFRTTVLERGGSEEPMALFVEFRGREPRVDALLRQSGMLDAA